jgi:hypothetical protein
MRAAQAVRVATDEEGARRQMRRIGILLPAAADDTEFQARVGAFLQGLALLGWSIGRNVRIDTLRRHPLRTRLADLAACGAGDAGGADGAQASETSSQTRRPVPRAAPTTYRRT